MPKARDPAIPLLGMSPGEMLTQVPRETYTRICRATLLVIQMSLKASRSPSTGERENKCWSIHTMEDCVAGETDQRPATKRTTVTKCPLKEGS